MDNAYKTEIRRIFVIASLPPMVERNTSHLQILDQYLAGDRLRLRTVRDPASRRRYHLLQQRQTVGDDRGMIKIAEILLDEGEAAAFAASGLREIRKNRYLIETGEQTIEIDVYLGSLAGLVTAVVRFEDSTTAEEFELPFDGREVTHHPNFWDIELAALNFGELTGILAQH